MLQLHIKIEHCVRQEHNRSAHLDLHGTPMLLVKQGYFDVVDGLDFMAVCDKNLLFEAETIRRSGLCQE